jgi:hypothetical protein
MTYRMYGALIASLSVVALMLAANETFARSEGVRGGGFVSRDSISRPHVVPSFRHHRRNRNLVGLFWPALEDYAPLNGGPTVGAAPPISNDIRYTYTYDVPWDWAHRYPPSVVPSDRPYVSSCLTETVTVPGRDGSEQTVNVMRCN